MRYTLLFLAMLLPTTDAAPQTPTRVCIRHLVPPTRYPMMARLARLQGTVVVRLTIAPDGSVSEATTETKDPLLIAHPILQSEIKQVVQTWTFECLSCTPGSKFKHTISFSYRLEGAASDHSDMKVSLDLPDKVTVVARPPVVDVERGKPKAQSQQKNK